MTQQHSLQRNHVTTFRVLQLELEPRLIPRVSRHDFVKRHRLAELSSADPSPDDATDHAVKISAFNEHYDIVTEHKLQLAATLCLQDGSLLDQPSGSL